MERRDFLALALKGAAFVGGPLVLANASALGHTQRPAPLPQELSEPQSGDPDAPSELLLYKEEAIKKLYGKSTGPLKEATALATRALEISKSYLGVTRANNPQQVTQFLNLFGLGLRDANGSFVPFCASALGFVFSRAYCEIKPDAPKLRFDPARPVRSLHKVLPDIDKYYFRPHPACREMKSDAERRGNWVAATSAGRSVLPGWIVFYDWDSDGAPNHVGIVEKAEAEALHTIEFNTSYRAGGNQSNGGAVAPKRRSYDRVLGYIKTYTLS